MVGACIPLLKWLRCTIVDDSYAESLSELSLLEGENASLAAEVAHGCCCARSGGERHSYLPNTASLRSTVTLT